ncbi:MAG TPA: DUF4190 domain-containing protein [Mycobacterium sp.]|nr:DUF4190 domain-containing protein [Mycobacterium sp.]
MTGPRNGPGTAALVVAIAGLVFCWSVVGGIVCGVVAVILGLRGRGRAARGEANNGGIATAGMALGLVAVVVSLAFAVIWAYAWRDAGGTDYLDCAMQAGNDQKAVQACTDKWLDNIQGKFSISPPRPTQGST